MSAELEARRTSAAAVLADFKRETDAYIAGSDPRPDFDSWAWRLYTELGLMVAGSDFLTVSNDASNAEK